MQKVRLGRTGLEVSVAGLGCGGHSRLGMAKGGSAEQAADIVRQAIDLGVTFIDTARAYGTESAVGEGLKGRRDQVVLCTKAHAFRGDAPVTAAEMAALVEESLKRLATDHVDVFLVHGLTLAHYPHFRDVVRPELERQKAAGKIGCIGASELFGRDTGHEALVAMLPDDPFDVVMVGFNLINPSARERVFPEAQGRDVGTLIMFAVRRALSQPDELRKVVSGLIERGEVDPSEVDAEDPLGFLTDLPGAPSPVEAAYRFCRHEPGAQVILTGTGNIEHLKANIAAINAPPLPPHAQARLKAIFGRVDSVSGN